MQMDPITKLDKCLQCPASAFSESAESDTGLLETSLQPLIVAVADDLCMAIDVRYGSGRWSAIFTEINAEHQTLVN